MLAINKFIWIQRSITSSEGEVLNVVLFQSKRFLMSARLNFMEYYTVDTHLQGTGVLNCCYCCITSPAPFDSWSAVLQRKVFCPSQVVINESFHCSVSLPQINSFRSSMRAGCCPTSVIGDVREVDMFTVNPLFLHVLALQFPFCCNLKRHSNRVC